MVGTLPEVIELKTEEEAWEMLRQLVEGELSFEKVPKFTVGGWAKVDVHIPAEKYNSAITPYMMKGWIDLQQSIYRAYALAQGGSGAGRSLTDRDKERLELVVEVKSGSSDQSVDLQAVLEALVNAMVNKLDPNQITIVAISALVLWTGQSAFRAWLAAKKEVKLAEIEGIKSKTAADAHTAALSTIAAVAGVDKERALLLAKAETVVPLVKNLEAEADLARASLVRHVTQEDASINGVLISSDAGQSVTSRIRKESTDVRIDGVYKIQKVDTTVATGFRVHIADQVGKEMVADVAEFMTTIKDRDVIRDAEWKKTPVHLRINARERRGEFTDAKILSARAYDPAADGPWGSKAH